MVILDFNKEVLKTMADEDNNNMWRQDNIVMINTDCGNRVTRRGDGH